VYRQELAYPKHTILIDEYDPELPMRRFLKVIAAGSLLASSLPCFAISDWLHGPVFWFHGHYYGVYDQWQFDVVQKDGSKINVYRCGVALGPFGKFGTYTTRPWVRQLAPSLFAALMLSSAVWGVRRVSRGRQVSA
jgi:hypothetical protein